MHKKKGFPLKRVFSYLKPYYKTVILIAVLSIIGNLFYVAAPLLIGRAVDNIIEMGNVNFDNLIKVLIILSGLYIINALCVWLYTSLGVSVAVKTTNDIRRQAYQKLISLPLKVIDNMQKGDILSRFSADSDQITDAITQMLNQFFSGSVIILSALGFMLYLSPIVTIAVVISVPLMFLVSRLVAKKSSQKLLKMQKVMGTLSSYAEEHIRGARVVKAFNFEQEAQKQFDVINQELNKIGIKAQFIAALSNPSTRLLNYFSYSLVGLIGGLCVIYLNLSIGVLTSFLAYATLFSRPFNEFTSLTSQIISGLAGASRIFEIVDITLISKGENKNKNIIAKGEFDFVNVNFSYTPQKPLIRDFNLKVHQGQKIAIVGPTGAGKTTMINLLMRFYDANSGDIFLDGHNISDIPKAQYRKNFGMVLQDTWLFKGTVSQNIAFGKPDASIGEIIDAAKKANAHSFIEKLPNGYNTVIDENGENISLGQKQMLTIARAMLITPSVLILDEATSSIDILTEQKITQAFKEIMLTRTSFIIAHRLSTIKDADIIIVMNHGQIIEQGTHSNLLEQDGFYAMLYNSQFDKKLSI